MLVLSIQGSLKALLNESVFANIGLIAYSERGAFH